MEPVTRVTDILPEQKHFELLAGAMLLLLHLVTGANEIAHRFILRIGDIDAGEFARAIKPRQLIGIAAIGLHAVTGLARNFGWRHDNTLDTMTANEAAERITAWPGLVTELQDHAGMGGGEFFDQTQHVVMFSADDAVTAHLGGITRCERNGDGVVMHIQPAEQNWADRSRCSNEFGAQRASGS